MTEDFFNLYFRYREETEPPIIYHRWSLITCMSAFLGRRLWLPFGSTRIFPNCYTMLIGHPGTRKSTAIKLAKQLISVAGYGTFAAEKTSKEKFLLDLEGLTEDDLSLIAGRRTRRQSKTQLDVMEELFGKEKDDKPKEPKEVFIVADEFNEFVGSGNLEFLSLLGMLWDWDDQQRDYQFRLKNSKSVSIFQPTVSILAGNTHAGFVEAFPPQAIGQGFLSRLLLVYGEPSGKKIPFPPPPDEQLGAELLLRLTAIREKVVGPAQLTPEALNALHVIYLTWRELEDGRFKHYSTRRYTHLLKLCMLCAAMRCSTSITIQDVVYANTILTYTEADMPKALGEFGKSKDADVAGKIMSALYEATRPLYVQDLLKIVKNDLDKNSQLGEILMKLQNSGQIQQVRTPGAGTGYLPNQRTLGTSTYVDYSLMKEYEMKFGSLRRVK